MKTISPEEFSTQPFRVLDQDWALLVSGHQRPNPMTVSWGGFGTLWNRPMLTVYVRNTRHTFGCLEECGEFCLCFMPEHRRRALDVCGARSGRDCDKWQAAGLQPEPSQRIRVPRVAGASVAFECRIVAAIDVTGPAIRDRSVLSLYAPGEFHRAFWGEVVAVGVAS